MIRLGGDPLPEGERRRLDAWLAENPAHPAAFARARATWAELGQLRSAPGALRGGIAGRRGRARPRPAWESRGALLRAAAIAVLVLAGIAGMAAWLGDPLTLLAADYRTAPGERSTVTLPDGSLVQLDTASALAVRFNGQERRVALLAGTAYFTAAPMAGSETRPFVVEAADGTAKALGTQFTVEHQADGAEVTVAEHRVQVAASQPDRGEPATVVLSPGQRVHYDRASGLGTVTLVNVEQAMAWRRGQLVFDKVRLADVVATLNRYRRGRIVIADANLADRRVSGVFTITDLTGALASITKELGARTTSVPGFLTVVY